MFYYFGRKGRVAKTYPAPDYPLVIEPFAGSMAYSLTWRPRFAIGIERDERVVGLWRRLTEMSDVEIREFPAPSPGAWTSDMWVLLSASSNSDLLLARRTVNEFLAVQFEAQRKLALRHHSYARTDVLYRLGDYRDAPDVEATWFIDPPYQGVRDGYRHKALDYDELAEWCLTRKGQVIVCEGERARWLPFEHHVSVRSATAFAAPRRNSEHVLMTRSHRRCQVCSLTFPASRADARYCSPRCRQRASRDRRRSSMTTDPATM